MENMLSSKMKTFVLVNYFFGKKFGLKVSTKACGKPRSN